MDENEIPERMRRQLDRLPPDRRAKAEAAFAKTQTPEFRERAAADRAALDRERRETGTIAALPNSGVSETDRFILELRREREARGLSLADVAERSGIDKAALSRLENGQQLNPTINTLNRYACALGKRLVLSLEETTAGA
jgi:ribosome-binding protein aMBF1 (putative translation factor)